MSEAVPPPVPTLDNPPPLCPYCEAPMESVNVMFMGPVVAAMRGPVVAAMSCPKCNKLIHIEILNVAVCGPAAEAPPPGGSPQPGPGRPS